MEDFSKVIFAYGHCRNVEYQSLRGFREGKIKFLSLRGALFGGYQKA